jgi:DNA primase
MHVDPSTTKYVIKARISADGVVDKSDVVGAIFGQTEGLLGDELDLRDLQKSGRMGRIEVDVHSKKGKSDGSITMPSSLDQVETAILASALETIDRVGPCRASIRVTNIEDVRVAKKTKIVERAKVLLKGMVESSKHASIDLTESVRQAVQVEEIVTFGPDRCPAGPNIDSSDAIIVVEGRSDVLNLLKNGIKNAIAVEGTNVPKTIQELSKEKIVTVFVDGDRGGELILRELLQVAEVDFIAEAPQNREVEELSQKQIMKSLRNKMPTEQYIETRNVQGIRLPESTPGPRYAGPRKSPQGAGQDQAGTQAKAGANNGPARNGMERYGGRRDDRNRAKSGFISSFMDKVRGGKGEKRLSEEQKNYRRQLNNLSGTLKANFVNMRGNVLREVPVRDLADALKNPPDGTSAVIFDGIITQRLLDIAVEQKIATLVGLKFGNVTKQPTDLEVWTKADLE